MTSALSWQNSVSLLPALFCTLRPNFPVTPDISRLPPLSNRNQSLSDPNNQNKTSEGYNEVVKCCRLISRGGPALGLK